MTGHALTRARGLAARIDAATPATRDRTVDALRAKVESALPSKSARPSWSAVKAIAVSASGTRSKASASWA